MQKVIKVDFVNGKKDRNKAIIKSHNVSVEKTEYINNNFEYLNEEEVKLSERMDRIKQSIQRINKLMLELKENNNGSKQ